MNQFASLAAVETALEPFWPSRLPARHAYTTEYMQAFMDFLGNPQDKIPAIHLAGTSGKTSTAYYCASLLQKAGLRAGMLISPHLEFITERIQIDLKPLSERDFCDEFAIFMDLAEKSGIQLTYSELLYGFGYWEFVRKGADCMVIETGMGGLLDATNVITRPDKCCIITDIGFDHTNVLGNSLQEIATHKAGIIGKGNAVFCYQQDPKIMAVIESAARQKQADLHILTGVSNGVPATLPLFQQRNFGLASEAVGFWLNHKGVRPLRKAGRLEAANVHIPARMEIRYIVQKMIVLDSAHNVQKIQGLANSLQDSFPDKKIAVLVAFSKSGGRQIKDLLAALQPYVTHCIATQPPAQNKHGWHDPAEIAAAAKQAGIESVEYFADYHDALAALIHRPEPLLLATGSIYLHQYVRPLTSSKKADS
jgi:dihydrofolate synthase / folylpolyglutamate synthase